RRGEGSTTCSPVQTESSPACSAARARPSIVSTFAASPKLMPKTPIFTCGLLHGPGSAASFPPAHREATIPFRRRLGVHERHHFLDDVGGSHAGCGLRWRCQEPFPRAAEAQPP